MASLNDELDDRFVEVEIETSEVNRLRDVFEKNEKTISGLEENRQKIQNEYDLMKAEDDELDDKLKSQLKFIGKETYKLINIFELVFHKYDKMGCVFLMVVVPKLPHTEFVPNDHREYALHFSL